MLMHGKLDSVRSTKVVVRCRLNLSFDSGGSTRPDSSVAPTLVSPAFASYVSSHLKVLFHKYVQLFYY